MKILIATPDRDSTKGKHQDDFTGAFDPEARAFMSHHEPRHACVRLMVDLSQSEADRQRQVVAKIEEHAPEAFVWLGHGLSYTIPQLGLNADAEIAVFTGALAAGCSSPIAVFYACSMAGGPGIGGDGGMCDRVRDALVKHGARGCRVYGHVGGGHTTMRPFVRVFDGPEAKPGHVGGRYLVPPPPEGSARRFNRWRELLHGPTRFDFPFLTPSELYLRLED